MREILKNNKIYFILLIFIFILAICLRLDMYIFNRSFWFDEAALALNVTDGSFFDLFGRLKYYQSAPPMFLFETKILTALFATQERIFRFIPFLCSLFLLPLFYVFSKYFLYGRYTRLFALFLFAINTNLIYYSTEFKPYALDVFAAISLPFLVLLLKFKRPVLLGIIFALFPWYSYASGLVEFALVLVLFAYVLKNKKHIKSFLLFLLPQIINLPLFALHLGAIESTRSFMAKIWSWGYIQSDFSNFTTLLLENIFYTFHPYKIVLKIFPLLLPVLLGLVCFFGAVLIFKRNKLKFYLLLCPFFAVLFFAYFGLYPFYDRMTLFLTPIYLMLFAKGLERFFQKSYGVILLVIFMLASIYPVALAQINMKNLPSQDLAIFLKLKENYKKGDMIILDETSTPQFIYYSRRYDFHTKNVMTEKMTKDSYGYLIYLNSLDKSKNYWFVRSNVRFPDTADTRDAIEFFGRDRGKFIRYNEGKTDLYYVGK